MTDFRLRISDCRLKISKEQSAIRDKKQDGLDDSTKKPVEVISASQGIVVSVNPNWEPSTSIRGGNYIWIYAPSSLASPFVYRDF